jgi:glutathione S-transferase
MIQIRHRFTDTVLCEGETVRAAVIAATKAGVDLTGANLRGAYLTGANLTGADLRGAYLTGADLRGAYLRGADLGGAYLTGANLTGADLTGAKINWQSHALLSHLLFVAARQDVDKRSFAGLVAVSRDWCWEKFISLDHPLWPWALEVFAGYVTVGDGAPECVRSAVKVAEPETVEAKGA